jgi:hypothetical protein
MKRRLALTAIALMSLAILTSCVTKLTSEGAKVRILMKQEAPADAQLLGTVETSILEDHPTIMSVQNALRNKAAQLGGNLLVIDVILAETSGGTYGTSTSYVGNGRAYLVNE